MTNYEVTIKFVAYDVEEDFSQNLEDLESDMLETGLVTFLLDYDRQVDFCLKGKDITVKSEEILVDD